MITIDFDQIGGMPLKQPVLKRLQASSLEILKAIIGHLGIPDVGNYIISGCAISGLDITSGLMYIDGELCPFSTVPGSLATKIKKNVLIESLPFKNGSSPNVIRTTTAVVDVAGTLLSDFTRIEVYVHTDNNYTNADLAKLAGIEPGAEVNVQGDWTETNPALDSFIKNKPVIVRILRQGSYLIGDFGTPAFPNDEQFTISFPDVGTSNYQALVTLMSNGAWALDTFVMWTAKDKTSNSFKLNLKEPATSPAIQNLIAEYTLIEIL